MTHPLTSEDLSVRSLSVRAETVNEQERSIECVMCTEAPVRMYDYWDDEYFDEVLMSDGARMPQQLPLLDNHARYRSSSVIGSVRNMRREGNQWIGRAVFMSGDDEAERVWQRVRQGHLTDVSIGYSYDRTGCTEIRKGESAAVKGRTFTADKRRMRVVHDWSGRELSTTPIGADQLAKMRTDGTLKIRHVQAIGEIPEGSNRDEELTNGEKAMSRVTVPATEPQTEGRGVATEPASAPATAAQTTEAGRAATTQPVATSAAASPAAATAAGTTPSTEESIRTAERERVSYAMSFTGIRSELVQEAIREGWNREQINERFLQAMTQRTEPAAARAPAVHSQVQTTREDLQMFFLRRAGVDVESGRMNERCFEHSYCRRSGHENDLTFAVRASGVLSGGRGNLDATAERALEFSNRHRNMTIIEGLARALDLYGVEYDRYDHYEIVKRSVTTMQVAALMSNALGAMILDAFVGVETSLDWVDEVDVPNNLPQPVAKAGMVSRMKKRVSGQTPVPVTRDATEEYIATATFSQQSFIDRIDLLADRFGNINNTPRDIGIAAREVAPDLVYSTLLGNPNMADSNALFSAAHKNIEFNAPLGPETLASRKTAMANQLSNGRLIGARPGYLIVPESRSHYADELMGSSEKRDTTANKVYGTKNWAQGKYRVLSEPRLDVGCINPMTDAMVAAQPNAWFLAEAMKRWGLMLAYIRAAGRGPIIESYTAADGRIGFGTTIEMDIGIKAVAWEGLQKGTGDAS